MFSSYFVLCLVSASVTDAFLPPIQSKSTFVTSSRKLCVPDGRVGDIDEWVTWSNHSLLKLTGTSLLDRMEGIDSIHDVHSCSRYAVLSHGTQQDPIYNYFNQGALLTFQWPEDEVYQLPSRHSAPGGKLRDQRDILMERVVQEQAQTFPEAIRQTKTGQPFRLTDVLLWNVFDTEGSRVGQTALFDRELIVQLDSLDEY